MAIILLVTGPSGAGKTTTCTEYLKIATGTWAYVSQDDIRQLVVAGYASADDYEKNWSRETRQQWDVSIPICVDIAKRYQDVGINCVIDFFGLPDEFKQWKTILGATYYQLLVLLPDEQVVVSRNASRDYPQKLKERKVRTNYKKFTRYDELSVRVLDTTSMSLSEVMEEIQLLNQ